MRRDAGNGICLRREEVDIMAASGEKLGAFEDHAFDAAAAMTFDK